jgi:hypothetical protein
MMLRLRATAFALAEGVRLYVGAARSSLSDPRDLRRHTRPVGAELVDSVERGRA